MRRRGGRPGGGRRRTGSSISSLGPARTGMCFAYSARSSEVRRRDGEPLPGSLYANDAPVGSEDVFYALDPEGAETRHRCGVAIGEPGVCGSAQGGAGRTERLRSGDVSRARQAFEQSVERLVVGVDATLR